MPRRKKVKAGEQIPVEAATVEQPVPLVTPAVQVETPPPAPIVTAADGSCPRCGGSVMLVVERQSTRTWVHQRGEKPSQLYGCSISTVQMRRLNESI